MITELKKLNFDICTLCNHKCNFCSNPDSRTYKDKVSFENFEKVMDNVTKHVNIEEMGLSAKGEPLINKDIVKIVDLCKKKYEIEYLYFSTNGALLTKELAEKLFESGLDSIKFSINAITNDKYKEVHQKDEFFKVLENLKNVVNLKKSKYSNLKILISVVSDSDKKDIDNFYTELFGDDVEYINDILIYPLQYTPALDISKNIEVTKKCSIPFKEIYIDSNCHLVLCCKDYFKEVEFGNLLTQDFFELWNSKEFKELRNMHKTNQFPKDHICYKCLTF